MIRRLAIATLKTAAVATLTTATGLAIGFANICMTARARLIGQPRKPAVNPRDLN